MIARKSGNIGYMVDGQRLGWQQKRQQTSNGAATNHLK
jgi:hypothetical protein